jgi:hypothetical protein
LSARSGKGSATGGGGMQYSGISDTLLSGQGGYGYIWLGWGSEARKATMMEKAGISKEEVKMWMDNVFRKTYKLYGYDYDKMLNGEYNELEIIFDKGVLDDQYPEFNQEAYGREYLPDDYDLDMFLEPRDLIAESNNVLLDDKLDNVQELLKILKAQKERNDR